MNSRPAALFALSLALALPPLLAPAASVADDEPVMGVSPPAVTATVPVGGSDVQTVTVSNSGTGDLEFLVNRLSALPGLTQGPKIAVHVQDHVFTKGVNICASPESGGFAPTDVPCSRFETRGTAFTSQDIYVVVGQADGYGVGGASFGIDYDGAPGAGVDVIGWARCTSGLEFPSATWPAPGSGNVVTWNTALDCGATRLNPDGYHGLVGAFYVYTYGADLFRITEHTKLAIPSLKISDCLGRETVLPETSAGSIAFSNSGLLPGKNPCVESTMPPDWFAVEPALGTVPSGGESDLLLILDASGLLGGSYSALLQVLGSDPATPFLYVPVHLTVAGVPDIDVSPAGLDFGTVFSGAAPHLSLTVANLGTDVLAVSGVVADNPDYVVSGGGFDVDPGEETSLTVTLHAGALGPSSGVLVVSSNDPDEGMVEVPLAANVIPAPEIVVDPDSVHAEVAEGRTGIQAVTLSNPGGSDLEYTVTLHSTSSPGPAAPGPRVAVHVQDHIQPPGTGFCTPAAEGGPAPTDLPCSEFETAGRLRTPTDLYIVVGDADSTGIAGIRFGIQYDSPNLIGGFHLCASGLQFPSPDWPRSGSGNLITWNPCSTLEIPPNGVHGIVGSFYVYAYGADSFSITENTHMPYPELSVGTCLSKMYFLDPATAAGSAVFSADGSMEGKNPCDGTAVGGPPPPWLTADPEAGTVAPGHGVPVALTADATELTLGTYTAFMRIHSNDPLTPLVSVPVVLDVVPPPVEAAAVEVEPGTLNPTAGGGWVQASVELPEAYDPADIVLETVRVLGTVPADPGFSEYTDFNDNGITDRKMRFNRSAFVLALPEGDSVEVAVTGDLGDDATFVARDRIRVIRPRMLAPNGGESFQAGTWVTVTWEKPAGWEDFTSALYYWSEAAAGWVLIADGVLGTSKAWQVVDEPSKACRLRVEVRDAYGVVGFDGSDDVFTIAGGVTGSEEPSASGYVLLQNTPNPFRGATTIRFSLPEESPVSIDVFDVSGRRVRSLVGEILPAGWHDTVWNGTDAGGRPAASGIYFSVMRTPRHTETKRMFLIH